MEVGLGRHFQTCLSAYPAEPRPLMELCTALAKAGPSSADAVLATLQDLSVFAEPVEDVGAREVALTADDVWQAVVSRVPPSAHALNFCISAGTVAAASSTSSTYGKRRQHQYYHWKVDFQSRI